MCNLKATTHLLAQRAQKDDASQIWLSFENKDPACVSRISSETFSEPYGGSGLHQKQILFVLFLSAASCDFV